MNSPTDLLFDPMYLGAGCAYGAMAHQAAGERHSCRGYCCLAAIHTANGLMPLVLQVLSLLGSIGTGCPVGGCEWALGAPL